MRPCLAALAALALCGCTKNAASGPPDAAGADAAQAAHPVPHAAHAPVEALPLCPAGEGDYLERAARYYDADSFSEALSCAAQAAAAEPDNPDAHSERAAALVSLGKYDQARVAYARALAIEPDHGDALMGAADLYLAKLPFSREYAELGLAYAERGRAGALRDNDELLAGRFAAQAASALNDLGRARDAEARADEAIAAGTDVDNAVYEKASALWELCRFGEARLEFAKLVDVKERAAHAHYYLGLLAERAGEAETAERELAESRKLDSEAFPAEVKISREEFAQLTARAVAALPEDMRRDIKDVPVTAEDLPALEDLIASDPPLSPSIVGLFRGPPLTEPCTPEDVKSGPCRAVVLYRKNMARSVKDRPELEHQVDVTLHHEIGHLRGEDDTQLVARGLE